LDIRSNYTNTKCALGYREHCHNYIEADYRQMMYQSVQTCIGYTCTMFYR